MINTLMFLVVLPILKVECSPRMEPSRLQLENYCKSLRTCQDCKHAKYPCQWCHNVGCTSFAHQYCPNVYQQSLKTGQSICPKIEAASAIFVAADIRNIIKVNLTTIDSAFDTNHILCILQLDYKTVQGAGTMHGKTIYCDMEAIKIKRGVRIGKLKIKWGGADPISNNVLVVVYRCEGLANNCDDCKNVHDEFDCGWCEETSTCSVLQNCPRQQGKWTPKGSSCYGDNILTDPQFTYSYVKATKNKEFKTFLV